MWPKNPPLPPSSTDIWNVTDIIFGHFGPLIIFGLLLPGGFIILRKCTKNHDHMLHCSWDTARDGCNFFFSFWAISCAFILLTTKKKSKLKKKRKNKKSTDISSFYTCTKNYDHMMYGSWDMVRDERTDRQMEKVTYWGGCLT